MKSNSLTLEGVVVAREGEALTPPITITLAGGELLLVRGNNGSGKSTMLKTLAGLLPAAEGEIRVNGEAASAHPILYLGHKRGLIPEMSVYDNVAFWGGVNDCRELIPAALHYFDLDDVLNLPLHQLSAGWQQRVALSRLITTPSILWLLDEPTAHLDAAGVGLLQSLIQSRMEQGGMIVIASHYEMQGERIKTININDIN